MEQMTVNSGRLAYRCEGDPSAPWLVVANSLAADHRMWAPQMSPLTSRFRVLRFDARGHGQSEPVPGPYGMEQLVSDVIGLMDGLEITRAHYLGLSLGGMVGLGLAIGHPDRIGRLACCAAIARAPGAYAQMWRERIDSVQATGLADVVDGTIERWFTPAYRSAPGHADTLNTVREMILGTSVAGYCGCAAALAELDYQSSLRRIESPVLYVAGAQDQAAPPAVMTEMAAATPKGRIEIIEDAAHLVNLEQPLIFSELVANWLAAS
jgi:3-oxoadipate enol-lactonase